ncbi:MAG: phytoene desaturase family protein [Phenylobacterium sp.]|uniref:phytoene desaturase family protein n=1 Tax=Phenylobacterium sp. TaxID=1871053 RepID=UPI0039197E26
MSEGTVLIIGGGVGGLSAGCYAQMNGYRATILEAHNRTGGVCTSWTRDGYVFDGCIHNLAGTSADSGLAAMWRELGVFPRLAVKRFDELVCIERPDGEPFTVYTDLRRLQAHMKALSPRDAPVIDAFIGAASRLVHFDLLGLTLSPPRERARALAVAAPTLLRWGRMTLDDYAARFSDPFLRSALPRMIYDWPAQTMLMALFFLARTSVGDLGWPVGGSQALSGAIEERFRRLGGEVRFGARVDEVLVEADRAVGVRLADGAELRADIVVSNANGKATIEGMLGGRYTSPAIRAYYAAPEDRIEMGVHVCLGVARDLSALPHALILPVEPPVTIDAEARERLYVEPFAFDATMAAPGKTALKAVMATSYSRWAALAADPPAYARAKASVAEAVIAQLDARFPGLRKDIEVVDVATPATTLRFTGNGHGYRGSTNAMLTSIFAGRRLSQTLPGLANFYMVGQWAGIPGVSSVAAMGREVARQICRRDVRPFRTSSDEAVASVRALLD